MTAPRRVPSADPVAQALTTAIKGRDSEGLAVMLVAAPELAACLVSEPSGEARTPLHLLADAPGGRPRASDTVRVLAGAGADLNAPAVGMWHTETPLHWAASNGASGQDHLLLRLGSLPAR